MAQFVNYKKRSIDLPPGCKDLMDVLNPASRRSPTGWLAGKRLELVKHEEHSAGLLSDIGKHLTRVLQSRAQVSALCVSTKDNRTVLEIAHEREGAMAAYGTFPKDAAKGQAAKAFLDRYGFHPSQFSGTSVSFSSLFPLAPKTPLLAKLAVDLFSELGGLGEKSEVQFRYLELRSA
ncbi:hypothetical protein SBV1_2030019 [Verrucomicrobia bacterium]|nr:hypothetical protein SBV1_2030019 [Verrucomicrobiota bacterium]